MGGDTLNLIVISAPAEELNRLRSETFNNSDDVSCNSNEYVEKPIYKVTVPDTKEMTNSQKEKYIVYNIYVSGTYTCSRRYKEFDVFYSLLKQEFPDYSYPSFPKKWPFKLSEQQLENRRKGLENFLDKICSVRVIFETDIVKEFVCFSKYLSSVNSDSNTDGSEKFKDSHNNSNGNGKCKSKISSDLENTICNTSDYSLNYSENRISLTSDSTSNLMVNGNFDPNCKIKLPDNSVCLLVMKPNQTSDELYTNLVKNIKLDAQLASYFYLFEIIDDSFGKF